MSDSLISMDKLGLAPRSDTGIEALTKTSDFLPQFRVYGSESTIVKKGQFPMGHLGLYFSADKIVDLGEAADVLVVDWRPRVCIVTSDQPISYYGKLVDGDWSFSPEFEECKNKAMAKVKGYLCGLEYLLWLPVADSFGLFLMGNPTLRRESAKLKALTGNAATLKIKLIETKDYTWHGVEVFTCNTLTEIPDQETIISEVNNFRDPKDSAIEMAPESQRAR